jgi:hypothetical protein
METLITTFGTLLGILVVQYFMTKRQNNYLSKKFEKIESKTETNTTDKKILDSLEIIKKDITYLNDIHKYTAYLKTFKKKIDEASDNIIAVKKVNNCELRQILSMITEKAFSTVETILNTEFKIDINKHSDYLDLAIRSVKSQVSQKKLMLLDPNVFLEDVTTEVKKEFQNFLIEFTEISKLENGTRRKAYEESVLKLIKITIGLTIDIYNEHSITNERAA